MVVIYLTGQPFHRVVVDLDQPEHAHRRIDAALLHSKKTTARRSLRSHRRSATDRSAPDRSGAEPASAEPAGADQRGPRHRTPTRDPERLPAHAAPPHWRRSSEQPHTPAGQSASATPLPLSLEGPGDAWPRFGEAVPAPSSLRPILSSSETAGDKHHDLATTTLPPPGEIDPDVAARLRLYEYRAGASARHNGGAHSASSPLGPGFGGR